MEYLIEDKSYYKTKVDTGLMCIVFIKKNGDLRVMLCTSNIDVLSLYGCISNVSTKEYNNNLSVVDILIDRPSYISLDRVLSCEYISYIDLITKGKELGYNLYEKLSSKYDGIDTNTIIINNL